MHLTQDKIEGEIGDLIPRHLRKAVAAATGIYPSVVYAYFNGDDERQSPAYKTLRIQDALDTLDAATGERVWQKICAFREESKPHERTAFDTIGELVETTKRYTRSVEQMVDALADGRVDEGETIRFLADLADIEAHAIRLREGFNAHLAAMRRGGGKSI